MMTYKNTHVKLYINTFSLFTAYRNLLCPLADQILPMLPAPHKMLSWPGLQHGFAKCSPRTITGTPNLTNQIQKNDKNFKKNR